MSIIVTKLVEETLGNGNVSIYYPDFCIIKESFCYDPDDKTFATIGLGGGTEITKPS